MGRFEDCLSWILFRESGLRQPKGGPWVRTKDGFVWDDAQQLLVHPKTGATKPLPTRHNGYAYDDDPRDSGGRTCMGVIKRVYDAYRKKRGLPVRDVWRISDDEITEIYKIQYWNPLRADELPDGLDLLVFDMGVNAGIGAGAKLLQRTLKMNMVDSVIGEATLAAAWDAAERDYDGLLTAYTATRERYYRSLNKFSVFGKGWLTRNSASLLEALKVPEEERPATMVAEGPRTRKAPQPQAKDAATTVADPAAVASGGSGAVLSTVDAVQTTTEVAEKMASVGQDPTFLDIALALMQSPKFLTGIILVLLGIWTFVQARRSAVQQGA